MVVGRVQSCPPNNLLIIHLIKGESKMAVGDTYKVTANSGLNIRTGPGTNYSKAGALAKGTEIVATSINGDWVQYGGGWLHSQYLTIVGTKPEEKVTTTNQNSNPPTSEENSGGVGSTTIDGNSTSVSGDDQGSGYQVNIDEILASQGDAASGSEFARIKNLSGVFGLPYQFLPSADPRLYNSMDGGSDASIGYEYAANIIERIPLLLLLPGKASFMTQFSKKDKENIIEKMINVGAGMSSSSTDDLVEDSGRYYTFESDEKRYYQFVNPMCRIAAIYLGIQDMVLNGSTLKYLDWASLTKRGISSIADFGDYMYIPFYVDTDASISESFSNSTTQSMIASTVNSISDMGRELNFLLGYGATATGVEALMQDADVASNIQNVQDTIGRLLGSGNFLSNLANHLTTVAAGGKLTFPEIWSDSSFSRSYNCEFKFISPDPSPFSVYLNVLVPLFHLLGLVCPQSIDKNPNGYTNPFLIRAIYKGMFNVDMGIITDMSVTKGAECQWTPEGIPTSINVSIGIKDLYQAMSITPTASTNFKYDTLNNTALMDYIANLCGINVYKPEASRLIEMKVANTLGRVPDYIKTDIWGGIQDKVQNAIIGIYR